MGKSCHSSGAADSVSTLASSTCTKSRNSSTSNVYLKHLNKLSHKISKPNRTQPSPPFDPPQSEPLTTDNNHQMAAPPPVYTINKDDFRDVVQRLTGSPASSPARERLSSPPPPKSKPSNSRLQKIRPPPLAQISNRPVDMLSCAVERSRGSGFGGQWQPLSPLPPFPTVHAAAESPVSAYMRFLQNTDLKFPASRWNNVAPPQTLHYSRCNNTISSQTNVGSPRWNSVAPPHNLHYPPYNNVGSRRWNNIVPPRNNLPSSRCNIPPQWDDETPPLAQKPQPPSPLPAFPLSPLPFGCLLPSQGMFSPSLLFSPTGQLGFPQLPLSPTLPVPSPRWRED